MDKLKSYIWDLDGTLLDSYHSIVASLAAMDREFGVQDSEEAILKTVKQGSVSAYLRALSAETGEEYEKLHQIYQTVSRERMNEITLIPGAVKTLEILKNAGGEHFVYTHRGKSTGPLLERLGLTAFFTETVTFEYGFAPKPSGEGVEYLTGKYGLEKALTAYVGDRTLDVLCAKNAGVKAFLYLPEESCVIPTGSEDRIIRRLEELTE